MKKLQLRFMLIVLVYVKSELEIAGVNGESIAIVKDLMDDIKEAASV